MQIFLAYLKFFYYLCSEIQKLIKMKKILFIIMAALTMVGCNGNDPKKNTGTVVINNADNNVYTLHICPKGEAKLCVKSTIGSRQTCEFELEVGEYEIGYYADDLSMKSGYGCVTIEKDKKTYFSLRGTF